MTPPLPPLHRDDALALWSAYADTRTGPVPPEEEPWIGRFGDSAALADQLLDLVLAGTKRATAGLVADHAHESEPLPRVGGHWVVCDGAGRPRCVLRTVELRLGPLDSVDDAMAHHAFRLLRERAKNLVATLPSQLEYLTHVRDKAGAEVVL